MRAGACSQHARVTRRTWCWCVRVEHPSKQARAREQANAVTRPQTKRMRCMAPGGLSAALLTMRAPFCDSAASCCCCCSSTALHAMLRWLGSGILEITCVCSAVHPTPRRAGVVVRLPRANCISAVLFNWWVSGEAAGQVDSNNRICLQLSRLQEMRSRGVL